MMNNAVTLDVELSRLRRDPDQPRRQFSKESIRSLADSMAKCGQLVPLLTWPMEESQVGILDGERRFHAAQLLEWKSLRCEVLPEKPAARQLRVMQLVTACHREDLSLADQFQAYASLQKESGYSGVKLAEVLSVSQATVSKVLSLKHCTAEEWELIQNGKLGLVEAWRRIRSRQATASEQDVSVTPSDSSTASGKTYLHRKPGHIVQLATPLAEIRLASTAPLTVADLQPILEGLLRDVRKARSEQFDIRTFERVLRDRRRAAQSEQGGAP